MTKIVYREHLLRRIKERKFLKDYPQKIYKEAKIHYFDNKTRHAIAISKLEYAGKLRNLAIAYDKAGDIIEIITIYPISEEEIKNKVDSGRWRRR